MSAPWFRMYHEWVSDPKVQLLAFEDQRHFVALLCLKANGTLDSVTPGKEFRDRMIAKALGLSSDAAIEAKRRLVEVGLIAENWQPSKWTERQYQSDSSTERTRAWRARNKGVTSPKRHSDDDVTDKNRTEQNRTDKPRASRRVPDDFSPDRSFALAELPDLDVDREVQRFRDFEFSKPRKDWDGTWRNWVRTCRDTGRYAKTSSKGGDRGLPRLAVS